MTHTSLSFGAVATQQSGQSIGAMAGSERSTSMKATGERSRRPKATGARSTSTESTGDGSASTKSTGEGSASTKGTRRRRRLAIAAGVMVVGIGGLWYGVNHTSWMGPLVADGLRAVLGNRFVAFAEDTAYSIQDRIDRWRYKDQAPKTYWEVPSSEALVGIPAVPTQGAASSGEAAEPAFRPANVAPPYPNVAAPGDGVWIAIPDGVDATAAPVMWKTLLHPDPKRVFATLAVVALDRRAVDVHLVAGTSEPESPRVPLAERPGKIPAEHHAALIAAFNGGFKATHGQFGMLSNGREFLPPRDVACTFVHYNDGRLAIAPWSELKQGGIESMRYYRQTPPCLVQSGEVEKRVENTGEVSTGWGATVSGETVIRRSAIALSEDGKTLYYGIGDALTAQSLARGMKAAGSFAAAQLDVNYSYPRFLVYSKGDGAPFASSSIIPAVEFTNDQYVKASPRDFFYVTREPPKQPG